MHRVSSAPRMRSTLRVDSRMAGAKSPAPKRSYSSFSGQGIRPARPPGLLPAWRSSGTTTAREQVGLSSPSEVLLSIQSANKESGELNLCHPAGLWTATPKRSRRHDRELGAEGNPVCCAGRVPAQRQDQSDDVHGLASGKRVSSQDSESAPGSTTWWACTPTSKRKRARVPRRPDQRSTVFVVTEIKEFPYELKRRKGKPARRARRRYNAATTASKPAASAAASAPLRRCGRPLANPPKRSRGDPLEDIGARQKGRDDANQAAEDRSVDGISKQSRRCRRS